jgi:chemotaxis protein MotB
MFEIQFDPPKTTPSTAWMITFADLVSLLLAFFVLLFAMSNVKTEKWQAVVETLSERLNPDTSRERPVPAADFSVKWLIEPERLDLDYASAVLREKMKDDPLLANATIQRFEDRLMITFPSDSFFEPQSARLTSGARYTTFVLAEMLHYVDNRVEVYGHAGPGPVETKVAPSKWESSLTRAVAVARALRKAGLSQSITAYGMADTSAAVTDSKLAAARKPPTGRIEILVRESSGEGGRSGQ